MAAITSAVVGVVGAGVSIGMSVDQANKAAAQRRKAEQAAKKAMDEARRETEIMPMQELSLNLDAYEQAREAQNVAAATGIQAAQQAGSRELAAAVGRQQMVNIAGQQQIRAQQGREMMELDKLKATERAQASEARKELAIGEAEGAQAAAADAAARQQQATTQAVQAGVEGLGSAMNLYSSVQGPYDSTASGRLSKSLVNTEAGIAGDTKAIQTWLSQNPLSDTMDVSNLGSMTDTQFQGYLASLTPEQIKAIQSGFEGSDYYYVRDLYKQ